MENEFVKSFSEISFNDSFKAGYNSFFLGEVYVFLKEKGINIPEGFVVCQDAYSYFLESSGLKKKLGLVLDSKKLAKNNNIKDVGIEARTLIINSDLPEIIKSEIRLAKSKLHQPLHSSLRLSVRFGMHEKPDHFSNLNNFRELFLNVSEEEELFKACLKCYAALFADDEIQYRINKGIDHFLEGICICVQKMVRSDLACSGILYGISPEKTESESIKISGCWGMMENLAYNKTDPDIFAIPAIKLAEQNKSHIVKHLGDKSLTLIYFDLADQSKKPTFVNIDTLESKRKKFVLKDSEIIQLAQWSMIAGDYFRREINIVWSRDGLTNELFLVRALLKPGESLN